jgi:segregation and condensation protein A
LSRPPRPLGEKRRAAQPSASSDKELDVTSEQATGELDYPRTPGDAFRLALPNFEGPLDLLLHLIREHRLDIFDIPIALITEKYLEYLARMREINLDIAGEFLVMASSLAHIKSRLLLPRPQIQADLESEEQSDPRAELVRRLLEYQKYREAAETLSARPLLDRDVFTRRASSSANALEEGELPLLEVSIYRLIEALDSVIRNATPEVQHEVTRDRITISDAIHALAERLHAHAGQSVPFKSLFEGPRHRDQIIATFLAVLEMCRLRLIRIFQESASSEILVTALGDALSSGVQTEVDSDDYR